MRTLLLLVFLLTFSATSISCAQSKTTQKEKFQSNYENMKTIVQGNSFKFIGNLVYDSAQRKTVDAALNTISINGNELSGNFSTLEATDKRVELDGQISNYKIDYDDEKQTISISFLSGQYNFYIDIKANGYAFLAVKFGGETINQIGSVEHL